MKHITLKLCLLLLLAVFTVEANAATSEIIVDQLRYSVYTTSGTATVTGLSDKNVSSVVIPEYVEYNGEQYSVTSIGSYAFEGCSGLTSVTIPNSVTSIGSSAFKDCSGLNSVRLGVAVISIGENAFGGCELDDIYTFSKVPPTIYANSFSPYSYSYAIVTTPDTSLDKYKIEWSDFLHFRKNSTDPEKAYIYTVDTPGDLLNLIDTNDADAISKLKLIGEINGTDLLVLNKMVNITSLDLSEATIVSGGMPYYDKDNERFGTEDNTLGNKWAYNLNLIQELELPESLIKIGSYAFSGKKFLIQINIPGSVSLIGSFAFDGCTGLKKQALQV
ncbi:MAG: leucine-rich repeat domain-containing protein [Muribaculaceae bacterium]|nr:leucine-rich repeat domain-containing protein [Muribaculaceae bacterium]